MNLYSDFNGRVECAEHAPRRTSSIWYLDSWQRMPQAEVDEWVAYLLENSPDYPQPCEHCRTDAGWLCDGPK